MAEPQIDILMAHKNTSKLALENLLSSMESLSAQNKTFILNLRLNNLNRFPNSTDAITISNVEKSLNSIKGLSFKKKNTVFRYIQLCWHEDTLRANPTIDPTEIPTLLKKFDKYIVKLKEDKQREIETAKRFEGANKSRNTSCCHLFVTTLALQ